MKICSSLRTCLVVSGALVLWGWAASALAISDLEERALHIAWRIDHEMDPANAARAHAQVARLVIALEEGTLADGPSPDESWLGWGTALDRWHRQMDSQDLPVGQALFREDLASSLVDAMAAVGPGLSRTSRERLATAAVVEVTRTGAAANAVHLYPATIAWARSRAPWIWTRLLRRLEQEPEWLPLIAPLVDPWLARTVAAPVAEWQRIDDRASMLIADLIAAPPAMEELIEQTADQLLDESLLVERARFGPTNEAAHALFLAGVGSDADHLHDLASFNEALGRVEQGSYAEWLSTLLGLVQQQRTLAVAVDSDWLLNQLARLDGIILPDLNRIDPRLTVVYQQLRRLLREQPAGPDAVAQQLLEIASLASVIGLDVDTLRSYVEQPIRQSFQNDLIICLGLRPTVAFGPPEPITDGQFNGCVNSFRQWGVSASRSTEMSGQIDGPFDADILSRESRLSPWQRLNYWLGYVREQGHCEVAADPVVNPVEWALASHSLVRFVSDWPQLMTADTRSTLAELQAAGEQAAAMMQALGDCSDREYPLLGAAAAYEGALDELSRQIDLASAEFRMANLETGADINLALSYDQPTQYIPSNLSIAPCGEEPSCGMEAPLPASNALFGLFPESLLVAHQANLGSISLCYTDVSWVDRRAVVPPVRNKAMASYFGRLSFVLRGTYSGLNEPVFEIELQGNEEYEYLFGANQAQVLDDPCPRHLVNTQVVGQLEPQAIKLVPPRLTYMTADRTHPSRVFEAHWESGEQWRDWFVTGRGVNELSRTAPDSVLEPLQRHLVDLNNRWNDWVYDRILSGNGSLLDGAVDPLVSNMRLLEARKQAWAALGKIIAPEKLERDPVLRSSVFGEPGLFDRTTALRLRQAGVPAAEISRVMQRRFALAIDQWRNLAAGTVAQREPMVTSALLELVSVSRQSRPAENLGDEPVAVSSATAGLVIAPSPTL